MSTARDEYNRLVDQTARDLLRVYERLRMPPYEARDPFLWRALERKPRAYSYLFRRRVRESARKIAVDLVGATDEFRADVRARMIALSGVEPVPPVDDQSL